MSFLKQSGEKIARVTGRRDFLKRSATIIFGTTAAAAAALFLPRNAFANYCPFTSIESDTCSCAPPNGHYCSGCSGYFCPSNCSYDMGAWYPNGACWCTAQCYDGGSLVYFVCCDCWCPGSYHCGCEQQLVA